MKHVRQKLANFIGNHVVFGLDVHKKSWKVTIRLGDIEQRTFNAPPDPEKLFEHLSQNYPGASYEGVYEAGFTGFWVSRKFQKLGVPIQVVHPADVPTTDKERDKKSDTSDSRKLARGLFNKELNAIHVPTVEEEGNRELVRSRDSLVQQQTRIKNQIKSMLFRYGISSDIEAKSWTLGYKRWLESLDMGTPGSNSAYKLLLRRLAEAHKEILGINKEIRLMSKTEFFREKMALIQTVPGIGLLTGMIMLTELGDVLRFKTDDHLCSYVGLVPSTHSSGENERASRMSRRGNRWVRHVIIESAWVAIRIDPALGLAYKEYLKRMEAPHAIIRIAKKLLRRIRFVLAYNKPYQKGLQ